VNRLLERDKEGLIDYEWFRGRQEDRFWANFVKDERVF
jgi:hypothetical protein